MRTGQLWSSYYSHCQGPSPPPQRPGEHAVQRGGEGLPVFGTVGARPAGDDARAPQVIHEFAHGEALADVVLRVLPAPGLEHGDACFYQAGGAARALQRQGLFVLSVTPWHSRLEIPRVSVREPPQVFAPLDPRSAAPGPQALRIAVLFPVLLNEAFPFHALPRLLGARLMMLNA